MLTKPDFIAKHLVVIQGENIRQLSFGNENIVVRDEDESIINQVSLHSIFAILVIGDCTLTTKLIRELSKHGILLALLRENLDLIDVIGAGAMNGNTLIRQKQYEIPEEEVSLAKQIVANKLASQGRTLKKIREKEEAHKETIEKLRRLYEQVQHTDDASSLLGIEGNAAKVYFGTYFKELNWLRREPRTKIDINNLLLDIGYTFLFHFIETLLTMFGFDTYKGVYHREFYARKSLVCDIQEPFRCIIDETLRINFNLGKIQEKDFTFKNGAYMLKKDATRKYSALFCEAILDKKVEIYDYVYEYYRYILDREKPFPNYIHK